MADLEIPVGYGLWQFYQQHTGIAHTAISTMGFKVATPPYTQAQCAAALAAYAAAVAPIHDSEVLYSRCVALIGNDGPLIRFEAGGSAVGSKATLTIEPPNVTYLIKKSTSFAGHRFRGRMYLPFVDAVDSQQTGALTGAAITLLQGRATALLAGLVAAGPNASELSLLHGVSTTVPPSPIPSPTPIVALTGEGFVATQRRRLDRS